MRDDWRTEVGIIQPPTLILRWAKKRPARQFCGGPWAPKRALSRRRLIATLPNSEFDSTRSKHSTSRFSNRNKTAISGIRRTPLPAGRAGFKPRRNRPAISAATFAVPSAAPFSPCAEKFPRLCLPLVTPHSPVLPILDIAGRTPPLSSTGHCFSNRHIQELESELTP
jgi:hypothetical protein